MNCPLQAKRCGGCSRLSVPYQKQLMYKQEKVRKLFACAAPIIGMKEPVHYRNKVISAFSHDKSGLISGMYAFGTHYVLPVDSCLLENARADEIICELRKILAAHGIRAYDENSKKGLIRFAVVRYAQKTKQGLVTIVTARREFPCGAEVAEELNHACPDVRTVVQNVNDRAGSAVMGFHETVLFGDGRIEDELCGLTLQLSSRAFYQVNSPQTEKLYQAAIEMAQVSREDHVLDAYCGIGVIGLLAAKKADRVTGIELNADAVHLAIENAAKNKIDNIEFIQGDTARVMETLDRPFSVAFLDPPRAGCDEAFLRSLCAAAPKKICYIACDIMTQARDAQYLKSHGYSVIAAQPVDMFPHTDHIETVVQLSRKKPDDVIEIDLNLDELDATSAETKATYEEIKEYVLKETGLKVSSLYISQVKRKCGLEVGESYNLPKSEKVTVPQCPKDKEDAIRAALKHFAMI